MIKRRYRWILKKLKQDHEYFKKEEKKYKKKGNIQFSIVYSYLSSYTGTLHRKIRARRDKHKKKFPYKYDWYCVCSNCSGNMHYWNIKKEKDGRGICFLCGSSNTYPKKVKIHNEKYEMLTFVQYIRQLKQDYKYKKMLRKYKIFK